MCVNIIIIIFAAFFIRNGIDNLKGNIDSVHWYNRTRITEETRPKYGKFVGIGTLIIAGGLIFSAVLNMLVKMNIAVLISGAITLITVIVGLAFILFAQFKYNKGIF